MVFNRKNGLNFSLLSGLKFDEVAMKLKGELKCLG